MSNFIAQFLQTSRENLCFIALYRVSAPNFREFFETQTDFIFENAMCKFIIMGDFNARTGTQQDYVTFDDPHNINWEGFNVPRLNVDNVVNHAGLAMLNFCKYN